MLSTPDLRKAALDGLIWGIGGKLLVVIAGFATLMITSRVLSASEFGVFAAATIFTDLAWALATSTVGVAMVQNKDLDVEGERAGFTLFLGIGITLAALMATCGGLVERVMQSEGLHWILLVLACFIPLKLLSGYYGALLQKRLDLRFYQLTQNVPQIIGTCFVTIVCVYLGWGVWALVAGFAASTLIEFLLACPRAKAVHKFPQSAEPIKALLSTGLAMAANRMMNFVATNSDRIIVGVIFGAASLGIYSRAYSLMMVPVRLIGLAISRVFLPVFSHMQSDRERLSRALQRVLELQCMFFIPISAGFVISTPLLVEIVLGSNWNTVIIPAQLFFIALFARLGYIAAEQASISIGQAWKAVLRQALYAAAVIVFGIVGAQLGMLPVVIGVTAAIVFFYGLSTVNAIRTFRCSAGALLLAHARGTAVAAALCWISMGMDSLLTPFQIPFDSLHVGGVVFFWSLYSVLVAFAPAAIVGESIVDFRTPIVQKIRTKLKLKSA